ncbi:MAG: hypothetical protein K0S14_3379 [Thermomicrobiales bacterium]|nr:hypothetical protein [Thermomicrobiales bacterium]
MQRRVFARIDERLEADILRLQTFVRQPSISAEGFGIRECAELLRGYLAAIGCDPAEVVETQGHPVVYGERWVSAPRTLLIYLMYDTQPVSGENWSVPPLEGKIVQQPPFGRCLVARGAKNSKGPLRAFLNAVEAIQEVTGTLPVNLLFVAEGEEELGSPNLPWFVDHYGGRLATADAALHPYALQEPDGRVLIWPGTKGLLYVEIEASGERWGRGPRAYDIHASQKSIVDSPAWRLIAALSTLVAVDGNSVAVDGFYDNVRPPTAAEESAVQTLAETFGLEPFKQLWQVDAFLDEETTVGLLRRYFFTPTLNLDGIWGGYTGPGSKTVLPHQATAKLDARLVRRRTLRSCRRRWLASAILAWSPRCGHATSGSSRHTCSTGRHLTCPSALPAWVMGDGRIHQMSISSSTATITLSASPGARRATRRCCSSSRPGRKRHLDMRPTGSERISIGDCHGSNTAVAAPAWSTAISRTPGGRYGVARHRSPVWGRPS